MTNNQTNKPDFNSLEFKMWLDWMYNNEPILTSTIDDKELYENYFCQNSIVITSTPCQE